MTVVCKIHNDLDESKGPAFEGKSDEGQKEISEALMSGNTIMNLPRLLISSLAHVPSLISTN